MKTTDEYELIQTLQRDIERLKSLITERKIRISEERFKLETNVLELQELETRLKELV